MARRAGEPVTDAPPSRYKVVERGRRLVVIDTRTGQPATREVAVAEPGRLAPLSARPIEASAPSGVDDRSGNAALTTSPLYDLKGPRRIVVGERLRIKIGRTVAMIVVLAAVLTIFFPFLWIGAALALWQPKLRGRIRGWITAQLDEAQAAS